MSIFIAGDYKYIITADNDLFRITNDSNEPLFSNVKQIVGKELHELDYQEHKNKSVIYLGVLQLDGKFTIFDDTNQNLVKYAEYTELYSKVFNMYILSDRLNHISLTGLSPENNIICHTVHSNGVRSTINIENFCDIKKISSNSSKIFILDKCGILHIWSLDDTTIKIAPYDKPIFDFTLIKHDYILTVDFDGQISYKLINDMMLVRYYGQERWATAKNFMKFLQFNPSDRMCICLTCNNELIVVMCEGLQKNVKPFKFNKHIIDGFISYDSVFDFNNYCSRYVGALVLIDVDQQLHFIDLKNFSGYKTEDYFINNSVVLSNNGGKKSYTKCKNARNFILNNI